MSAPMNANIGISSAALDGHLTNIRSSIPPSVRSLCLPESTSKFLRNILLAMIVLNSLLLLSSPFASGVRFMGSTLMLISAASCAHISILVLVLGGNHGLADTVSSSFGLIRLANTLRGTSARYGADAFVYGVLFGSTVVMALLMRVVSSYYGGVAQCITHTADAAIHSDSGEHTNLTGGYANNQHHNGSSASMDTFAACGASGPVGFVSFLSGLLFWFNAVLAATLYVRREELLSGEAGGGNLQYDEIGTAPEGFAGDFPSSNQQAGMRTMHV